MVDQLSDVELNRIERMVILAEKTGSIVTFDARTARMLFNAANDYDAITAAGLSQEIDKLGEKRIRLTVFDENIPRCDPR